MALRAVLAEAQGLRGIQVVMRARTPGSSFVPSSIPASDELKVLDREAGRFAFCRWKNMTVLAWSGQAGAAEATRLRTTLAAVAASGLGLRTTVSVTVEGLPPPTEEARLQFVDLMSEAQDVAVLAHVVQGNGFLSSAYRSVLTGMRVAATTRSYEMGIVSSLDELATWLPPRHAARTGVRIEPTRVTDVVRRALVLAAKLHRKV